jgi:hypothetical protein
VSSGNDIVVHAPEAPDTLDGELASSSPEDKSSAPGLPHKPSAGASKSWWSASISSLLEDGEVKKAKEAVGKLREPVKDSAAAHWRFEDRPLSAEEKKGLWVLFGIVGLGWLVGGLAAPKKTEIQHEHEHAH